MQFNATMGRSVAIATERGGNDHWSGLHAFLSLGEPWEKPVDKPVGLACGEPEEEGARSTSLGLRLALIVGKPCRLGLCFLGPQRPLFGQLLLRGDLGLGACDLPSEAIDLFEACRMHELPELSIVFGVRQFGSPTFFLSRQWNASMHRRHQPTLIGHWHVGESFIQGLP